MAAERVEITCPACGRVYWSAVRGDDTRCPARGCGRSVYVRLDGTYKRPAPAAAGDVHVDVAEVGEDQGDADHLEAPPAEALDLAPAGAGRDPVMWLCGAAIAGAVAWAWWADRRRRAPPAALVDVEPGRSYEGFRLPGSLAF